MWWHTVTHGVEKWRGTKRMEWVTSKRHMTAEHRLARAVQTLQVDAHSSSASSRLNWRPRRFTSKWTLPFRQLTKSGFCACAITFQTQSTKHIFSTVLSVTMNCKHCHLPRLTPRLLHPRVQSTTGALLLEEVSLKQNSIREYGLLWNTNYEQFKVLTLNHYMIEFFCLDPR